MFGRNNWINDTRHFASATWPLCIIKRLSLISILLFSSFIFFIFLFSSGRSSARRCAVAVVMVVAEADTTLFPKPLAQIRKGAYHKCSLSYHPSYHFSPLMVDCMSIGLCSCKGFDTNCRRRIAFRVMDPRPFGGFFFFFFQILYEYLCIGWIWWMFRNRENIYIILFVHTMKYNWPYRTHCRQPYFLISYKEICHKPFVQYGNGAERFKRL